MARTAFERARRLISALGLVIFVVVAVTNKPPERPVVNETMETVGFALLILAVIGRIWSALYLSGRKSKVLCMTGPFSLSRNPLYLFSFLGAVGLGLLTSSMVLTGVLAVAFLVYYHFVIRHEELRLAELFGDAFSDYCKRVPRLFPTSVKHYEGLDELTVRPRPFMNGVTDTSVFLWAFFVFEAAEAATAGWGWPIPIWFRLP